MITAYRLLARQVDYPLHLGVTEAGPVWSGTIKSVVGIGTLLAEGIGDTIRISLTGNPVEEVRVGKELLKTLGLRQVGVTLVSCPTCGRLDTPELSTIVQNLEDKLKKVKKSVTIAVMGCAVNGPGEAKEADIGVACGKNEALFFKKGKIVGKIHPNEIVDKIVKEVRLYKA
jgi:(E)-4-hydroxy-3-methylbut-2-enyl-diphosphate synthase